MRYIALRRSCIALVVTGLLSACDAPTAPLDEADSVSEVTSALATVSIGDIPCTPRAYAIIANTGGVTVNSGAKVDSYQLSKGAYGGSNVGQNGTVQAAKSITGNGSIGGKQIANSSANLPIVSVPSDAKNLPLGAKSPGSVTINSSSTSITLAPGSYVVNNLTVTSPGAIKISPQGKVKIWVNGTLSLAGNENLNGVPSNLEILVTSSGAVSVNSNGQLFGRIYAPGAAVNLSSPVFGSVVGSSVTLNSGSAVHFPVQPRAISTVVNATLAPQISPAFETYCQDLENEGYMVMVRTPSPSTAAKDLRNLLIADHRDYAIEGAFLIGNLPFALYEDKDHLDVNKRFVPYVADYYFMDLTGTWTDTDGDGAFNTHSDPDHGPEIYVGRLRADNLGQPEANLVNSYFQRNHTYRTVGSSLPQRAVSFNAGQNFRSQRLEAVYGTANVTDYGPAPQDPQLSGNRFLELLRTERAELYHIISDSGPTNHTFATPGPHPPTGDVNSSDIAAIHKNFHFFLLHACSAEDFATPNNLASTYLLVNSEGLATFGVTKSASEAYFTNWFAAGFLAMDQTLGMALFQLDTLFMDDELANGDSGEFYIAGDPTLKLNSKAGTRPAPSQPRQFEWAIFNNDYGYTNNAYRYNPGNLATYGGYYDLVYFTTLGTGTKPYIADWLDYGNRGFGDYNNDVEATTTAQDFALFTFDGSGVDYFAELAPDHGTVDIYVDFVLQGTASLYSATRLAQQDIFSYQWNGNGRHNILIVNKTAGRYGVVDYFYVRRDY